MKRDVEFYNDLNAQYPSDNPHCCYICKHYNDGELKVPDWCSLGNFNLTCDEEIKRDVKCPLNCDEDR